MSRDNKSVALQIATKYCSNYNGFDAVSAEEFEEIFDMACAAMNNGIEVEWLS
jgi:hypothetical protein